MPAPKNPRRAEFITRLEQIRDDLPSFYTDMVLLKLRQPRILKRIESPKLLRILSLQDPKEVKRKAGEYFNQAMKFQRIDFDVLDALEEIADEIRAVQPVTA